MKRPNDILLKFGGKSKYIQAVVVPNIKTKIDSNCLKPLVKKFQSLNIGLADANLGEGDQKIDLLLGANYAHIIPVQSYVVNGSLFYYTCRGVMLIGDIDKLTGNIVTLTYPSRTLSLGGSNEELY